MNNHKLPDLLAPNLRVIFVGTAAGKRSAELGHYYAGRDNRSRSGAARSYWDIAPWQALADWIKGAPDE